MALAPQTGQTPVAASDGLDDVSFQRLAELPPEVEWFTNITNANTRRAYHGSLVERCRIPL
jgi:hypothetical protein